MMNDRAEQAAVRAADQIARLDDLLSRWHHKCKMYQIARQQSSTPGFREAVSSRSWDSTSDIADDAYLRLAMKAIDFALLGDRNSQGAIPDPHNAALKLLARNLSTGRSVWLSPRLPQDAVERATVVAEARNILTRRLQACGVM
jgi:hypothetical protein